MSDVDNRPPDRGRQLIRELLRLHRRAAPPRDGERRAARQDVSEARAELARLKRCAGMTVAEAAAGRPEGMMAFYRLVPDAVGREEDELFLLATLFALAPPPLEETESDRNSEHPDMGTHLAALARKTANRDLSNRKTADEELKKRFQAVGRRLAVLLDCTREELPFRLRQTARLLASHEIAIQWNQLLWDVRRWDDPSRDTQKQWAQSFYQAAPTDASDNEMKRFDTEEDSDVD